jgi:hypothetical protein
MKAQKKLEIRLTMEMEASECMKKFAEDTMEIVSECENALKGKDFGNPMDVNPEYMYYSTNLKEMVNEYAKVHNFPGFYTSVEYISALSRLYAIKAKLDAYQQSKEYVEMHQLSDEELDAILRDSEVEDRE